MIGNKYWLISDDDVGLIEAGLQAARHRANDYNCVDWPPGSGCEGCKGDGLAVVGLHALHSGLHKTDTIPGDFEKADL